MLDNGVKGGRSRWLCKISYLLQRVVRHRPPLRKRRRRESTLRLTGVKGLEPSSIFLETSDDPQIPEPLSGALSLRAQVREAHSRNCLYTTCEFHGASVDGLVRLLRQFHQPRRLRQAR